MKIDKKEENLESSKSFVENLRNSIEKAFESIFEKKMSTLKIQNSSNDASSVENSFDLSKNDIHSGGNEVNNKKSSKRMRKLLVHVKNQPAICNKCWVLNKYMRLQKREVNRERLKSANLCLKCHSKQNKKAFERKNFSSVRVLNRHSKIHSNNKPYQCDTCEMTFVKLSNLASHRRIHLRETPHLCDIFDNLSILSIKYFNQLSSIRRTGH